MRWPTYLLFGVVYLYAFPYFDKLRSAQEMPRILLTQQIVDHQTFALNDRLKELGSWNDLSIGVDGRYYANKSPGPSFVAIPAYLTAKLAGVKTMRGLTWFLRVGAVTIPALLFLPILYGLLGRFTASERARRAALVAYALGTPAFVYSMLLLGHQLAAICLGTALYCVLKVVKDAPPRSLWFVIAAGFFTGLAPSMDYQAVLLAPVLGAALLLSQNQRIKHALVFAAAALPGAVLLGVYHYACFGSPFRISYGSGLDTAPKEGALGFIGPNAASLYNILLTPSNGLFTLSPWLLVGLLGLFVLLKRNQWRPNLKTLLCIVVIGVYTLFVGSMLPYMARGGWSAGARQLVATLPMWACLAARGFEWLEDRPTLRVVAVAAVFASIMVFTLAATTYPHWPDRLSNPIFELVLPLLGRGYAVASLGTLLGLQGLWSLLPLYLLVAGLGFWMLLRGSPRLLPTALMVAAMAVGGFAALSLVPRSGAYTAHALNFVISQWEPLAR